MLEEERTFEGVEELRKLFWDKSDDLTVCMAVALAHSLEYLKSKGGEIYALTEEAESYYQKFNRK
jgi:HD superfamily phosphohydrolase YqeK